MPEMILCAAIKIGDLVLSVPRPGRHHTIIHAWFALTYQQMGKRDDEEQGFLTTKGRFVGRKEAWIIAAEAGQVTRPAGGDGPDTGITSESMW